MNTENVRYQQGLAKLNEIDGEAGEKVIAAFFVSWVEISTRN